MQPLTTSLLSRACRIFMDLAYSEGPSSIPAKNAFIGSFPVISRSPLICRQLPRQPEYARSYAIRTDNRRDTSCVWEAAAFLISSYACNRSSAAAIMSGSPWSIPTTPFPTKRGGRRRITRTRRNGCCCKPPTSGSRMHRSCLRGKRAGNFHFVAPRAIARQLILRHFWLNRTFAEFLHFGGGAVEHHLQFAGDGHELPAFVGAVR